MNDTWIPAQLLRHVQTCVSWCEKHVPERAAPVQLETTVDGAHTLDARLPHASVPPAALAQLGDVREEVLDTRVVPVEHRRDERPGRTPLPCRLPYAMS